MDHKFQVELKVTEARGFAVSKYQGVTGTAIVSVSDADGRFSAGLDSGSICLQVKDISARTAAGEPMDLQQYLGEVLGKSETVKLEGWKHVRELKENVAAATITAEFFGAADGQAPTSVSASVVATGRGMASIAFKGLTATLSGARVLGA